MQHEALARYLDGVERAVLAQDGIYVEQYSEEILTPERANLRVRLRFDGGRLLEINEAVVVVNDVLQHLDYRYHCQDAENRLVFSYDSTPHFPGLASFPHHKHLPSEVVDSDRPDIEFVLREAATP